MKTLSLSLPLVALGGAAVLSTASSTKGWTTIGGSLNLNQRDVRVFNNFGNAAANNNTTPDANFPGYDGAEMAIWKAIVEWGSELHGNGNGDPHQPGELGSGGANFDASWQGNHTAIGGSNGNTVSERRTTGGFVARPQVIRAFALRRPHSPRRGRRPQTAQGVHPLSHR